MVDKENTKNGKFVNSIGLLINGGLFLFFVIFIPGMGVDSWLVEPVTKWHKVLNIGIFYVLIMYCLDKFLDYISDTFDK